MKYKFLALIFISAIGFAIGVIFPFGREKTKEKSDINVVSSGDFRNPSSLQSVSREIPNVREESYPSFASRLQKVRTSEELEKLFNELIASSSTKDFDPKMSLLLEKWGAIAPKQALSKVENCKGALSWSYPVFLGWASKNPEAAASFYNEAQSKYVKNNFLVIIAISGQWAKYSPDKALDWLDSQKGKTASRELQYGKNVIIREYANKSPEKIPDFIGQLSEIDKENNAYLLAERWAQYDANSVDWIEKLSEKGQLKAEAGRIMALSQGDLDNIKNQLSAFDNEKQSGILKELVYPLLDNGQPDMSARVEWIMDTMKEPLSNFGIKYRINEWLLEDRVEAKKWIDSLPDDKKKKQLQDLYSKQIQNI